MDWTLVSLDFYFSIVQNLVMNEKFLRQIRDKTYSSITRQYLDSESLLKIKIINAPNSKFSTLLRNSQSENKKITKFHFHYVFTLYPLTKNK